MKKKLIFIIFIIFMFPTNVFGDENTISISCSDTELKSNNELECEIFANEMDFIVTNIAGEVEISDNLIITNSSYDNNNWMILDENFNIQSINLISHDRNFKKNILIAKFNVKAINKDNETGEIKFKNIVLGDDLYEEHKMRTSSLSLNLTYDKQNEDITENPGTGNSYIIIISIILVLALGVLMHIKRKYIK